MAEEEQEISSAPQESEMSADELWEAVDKEDPADSGSDETAPETVEEVVGEEITEEIQEEPQEEEPQHDWEKRYKDLEKDYHKRNEDNSSFRRDTESKQGELERQLQALQIERLENKERLQKLDEIQKETPEKDPENLESVLSEQDKQTMKDFEEVMQVVNKIVDHKLKAGGSDAPPLGDLQDRVEETQQALAEIQYKRLVDHYDTVMKQKVGDDYLEIDIVPEFVDYVNANPVLKDILKEKTPDPEKHSWVVNTWLNTDEGRSYRSKKAPSSTQTAGKQQQKRDTAKSLAKNTAPPQEVDTSNMNEDELWDHIVSQDEQ